MIAAGRRARMLVEALPENLFREPIDLLFADHYRVASSVYLGKEGWILGLILLAVGAFLQKECCPDFHE